MAHKLNFANDKWSFVAKGEKAWHGLGQYVDKAMTAEEAIRLGGLDYIVEKRPLYINDPSKGLIEVPGHFSTVRTDTGAPLGVVKGRYTIVQNQDAFGFFNSIIDQGEAIFETAGALGLGEKIFVTAKLPEDMLVHGEKVEKYIILTNSHDGSTTIIAGFTAIRVVCNNTLQAALKNLDNKVSISHTASAESRLKEASRVMGIASRYMTEVNTIFDQMSQKRLSDFEFKEFITKAMKVEREVVSAEAKELSTKLKNTTDTIFDFAMTHSTQRTEAAYKTLWGAYNSISGYYTHIKDYKNAEQRMKDLNYGTAASKISKAFDLALEMVK